MCYVRLSCTSKFRGLKTSTPPDHLRYAPSWALGSADWQGMATLREVIGREFLGFETYRGRISRASCRPVTSRDGGGNFCIRLTSPSEMRHVFEAGMVYDGEQRTSKDSDGCSESLEVWNFSRRGTLQRLQRGTDKARPVRGRAPGFRTETLSDA
jgi:hypothetical protein